MTFGRAPIEKSILLIHQQGFQAESPILPVPTSPRLSTSFAYAAGRSSVSPLSSLAWSSLTTPLNLNDVAVVSRSMASQERNPFGTDFPVTLPSGRAPRWSPVVATVTLREPSGGPGSTVNFLIDSPAFSRLFSWFSVGATTSESGQSRSLDICTCVHPNPAVSRRVPATTHARLPSRTYR